MDEPKGGESPADKYEGFVYPDDPYGGPEPAVSVPEASKPAETALIPAGKG